MTFPTTLETLTDPGATLDGHTDMHNELNALLEAIQAKLGINASAVTTSLDYLLSRRKGARVRRTTVQAIPDVTLTAVSFESASFDGASFWSAGSPTRLTIPVGGGGVYLLTGMLAFASNATGIERVAQLSKNGSSNALSRTMVNAAAAIRALSVSTIVSLVAGDYIELIAYQDSTAALNTATTGDHHANLCLFYLGP